MTCWLIISVIVVMHIINIYSCSWHQAVTFNEQRNAIELQENRMEKWVSVLQLINIKSAFCKKIQCHNTQIVIDFEVLNAWLESVIDMADCLVKFEAMW